MEVNGRKMEQLAQGTVVDLARFGLAVFLDLAEQAVQNRLSLKLDY